MNASRQKRLRICLAIAAVAMLLVAMIGYNALRPSTTEADRISETAAFIIATDWEAMSPEAREGLRQQWESFDPDTRRQIFHEVARERVQRLRERLAGLSEDERVELIRETTETMRRRNAAISPEERQQVRERLNSEDGREMLRTAFELYHQAFSARERAELDPLMREWLAHVERMAGP